MKAPKTKGTGDASKSSNAQRPKIGDYILAEVRPPQSDQHLSLFLSDLCEHCERAWDLFLTGCPLHSGVVCRLANHIHERFGASSVTCNSGFQLTKTFLAQYEDGNIPDVLTWLRDNNIRCDCEVLNLFVVYGGDDDLGWETHQERTSEADTRQEDR